MQDNKSRYLHNQAVRRANEVRQRRATVENPQWAMSRPAEWYQNRENLASIKDTLVNQQGNRDFWTTDQDESRNMYQMLMNQMRGGGGARMMDLRGLPSVVQSDPNRYRRGRTMFQDPSKAQGFLGDVGSLLSGKNKAAVYADEYNPFPKAGFGADWYKDQFPIASGLGSLMEAAENVIPYASWAKRFLPKSNRVPLERDLSWVPEGLGEYDKLPMMEFEDEVEEFPFLPEEVLINIHPELDDPPPYHGRGELPEDFDYSGMREEIEFPYLLDKHMTRLEEALESIESGDTESEDTENVITEMYENPEVDETTFEDTFNERYVFTTDPERDPDTYPGVSDPWEYFLQMKGLLVGKSDAEIIDILLNSPDPVIKLR